MCTLSQKDAVNEFFVHTETDLVALETEDSIRRHKIAELNKRMTDLVHTLRLLQHKEDVHKSAENKIKINKIKAEIAEIDTSIRSLWQRSDAIRTMAEFDLVKTDVWPLGPSAKDTIITEKQQRIEALESINVHLTAQLAACNALLEAQKEQHGIRESQFLSTLRDKDKKHHSLLLRLLLWQRERIKFLCAVLELAANKQMELIGYSKNKHADTDDVLYLSKAMSKYAQNCDIKSLEQQNEEIDLNPKTSSYEDLFENQREWLCTLEAFISQFSLLHKKLVYAFDNQSNTLYAKPPVTLLQPYRNVADFIDLYMQSEGPRSGKMNEQSLVKVTRLIENETPRSYPHELVSPKPLHN